MAEYLALIYEDEASWEHVDADAFGRVLGEHRAFMERNATAIRGGNALQPTSTATSLRRDATGKLRGSPTGRLPRPRRRSVATTSSTPPSPVGLRPRRTVRFRGDIDLAEECVQDAYVRALASWPTSGVPARPGAWLTTVARRRAIDLLRRRNVQDRSLPLLVEPISADPVGTGIDLPEVAPCRLSSLDAGGPRGRAAVAEMLL
jgi:hypothetical protein